MPRRAAPDRRMQLPVALSKILLSASSGPNAPVPRVRAATVPRALDPPMASR